MPIRLLEKRSPGNSNVIRIPNARLRYAHVFKARAFKNEDGTLQDPKFQITALLDPSDTVHKTVIQEIKAESATILKEVFGEDMPKAFKEYLKQLHSGTIPSSLVDGLPYGSGDTKDADGFEGMFFINASSKNQPQVIGRDRSPLTAASGKPYPGCYADISLSLWVLNNPKFKKRIVGELRGVQFRADGDPFSGRAAVDVEEEFDDLGADEDSALAGGAAGGNDDDFLS